MSQESGEEREGGGEGGRKKGREGGRERGSERGGGRVGGGKIQKQIAWYMRWSFLERSRSSL